MSNAEKFTTNNKVNYFQLVESVNFPIPDFFITIIALVLIIFSIGNISLTIRRLHDKIDVMSVEGYMIRGEIIHVYRKYPEEHYDDFDVDWFIVSPN